MRYHSNDCHWDMKTEFNSNCVDFNNGYKISGLSEGLKYVRPEVLFHGISLGSKDAIILVSLVGTLVVASIGSSEGFKYDKLDGTPFGK